MSRRIHVVDDCQAILQAHARMLTTFGCCVTTSNSPFDALDVVWAQPDGIDLLVTDLEMPGMNGHQLLSVVKVLRPELPVLVVTGCVPATAEDRPADAYLQKPVTMKQLNGAIEGLLSVF